MLEARRTDLNQENSSTIDMLRSKRKIWQSVQATPPKTRIVCHTACGLKFCTEISHKSNYFMDPQVTEETLQTPADVVKGTPL